jgi:hypothetical protein
MKVAITCGSATKYLYADGESFTFAKGWFPYSSDVVVTFYSDGYVSYNGFVTIGAVGKSRQLACAFTNLVTDLVITAGPYTNTEGGESPFPLRVGTDEEMNAILHSATSDKVGAVYKYTGPSTATYKSGELYIIANEY